MKKIFVIILNFNGCKNTVECMESLDKVRTPQGYEIIPVIVDNASHDDSVKVFKKRYPRVVLLENKVNLGYSGGNNTGISYALKHDASHITILNNDTVLDRAFILDLIEALRNYKADVACPKIYFEKGFEYHKDRYKKQDLGKVFWFAGGDMDWANLIGHHRGVDEVDYGQYDKMIDIKFITGACFIGTKEVFEKVGGFNDKYFLYYEDADLSMRIRQSNFKIILAPKSIVYHKNAGSTGGSGSTLQDYFITRNRLLFGMHYASVRTKFALFRESIKLFTRGRIWQRRGVIDYYLHRLGKGTYPLP